MSYKIAVGSSDEIHVDLKFGEVDRFIIYEVDDDGFRKSEYRAVLSSPEASEAVTETLSNNDIADQERAEGCLQPKQSGCQPQGCAGGSGCGGGPGCGGGHDCGGSGEIIDKVKLISDCRCIVCKKIGFQVQKQFERKAISVFDIECEIGEALEKIAAYYKRVDGKLSLRKNNQLNNDTISDSEI